MFTYGEELHYWSMCLGGMNATNTSDCMVDDEAVVGDDGFVTLVIMDGYPPPLTL